MIDFKVTARSEKMPQMGGKIEGAQPLAGHLGLASLLVREAVQNSWDARDDHRGDQPVEFSIEGWDVDADQLSHLRRLLPVSHLDGFERKRDDEDSVGTLHPQAVLDHRNVQLLVVSDRNTVGLCGPTRSGSHWEPVRHGSPLPRGQQRFANFIRNTGRAATDIGHGDGGAFGVGKSALWMASRCGTILIHTRTTDNHGEPVERLIGVVHGDHFYGGSVQYTGRHFIGAEGADEIIEPLEGAEAAAAARGLPIPPYEVSGAQVDGTTIMILAPRLHLGWETEMQRIRDAVRWQVWPKLVPGVREGTDHADMTVRLSWNNNPIEVPEPLDDPEIRPYAKALLDAARARSIGEEGRDIEAKCGRPAKSLGFTRFRDGGTADDNVFHITLTESELEERAEQRSDNSGGDVEPAVDFEVPWGQIALVRREPLLLVKYEAIGGPEAATQAVGVFLSAEDREVEEALTKAEPPAHDDWIFKNVPKDHARDHRRTFAKRTVEEIKSARNKFLATLRPPVESVHGGGEQFVAKKISERMGGGLGGSAAKPAPRNSPGGGAKPRAQLTLVRSDQDGTNTVHEVLVETKNIGSSARTVELHASGRAHDNAGAMDPAGLVTYEWLEVDGDRVTGPDATTTAKDGSRFSLLVTVESHLRIRPQVKVMLHNGA